MSESQLPSFFFEVNYFSSSSPFHLGPHASETPDNTLYNKHSGQKTRKKGKKGIQERKVSIQQKMEKVRKKQDFEKAKSEG